MNHVVISANEFHYQQINLLLETTHKTRLPHHKAHDKHSEENGSKCHTSRHSKQHHVDKSDKHKLTKPESVVSNSRSKSPSRSKQTESVEVLEKTSTEGSMEHEKCELIEEQHQPASDRELSAEEEGDISDHCTDDKPVERISYTKVRSTLCNGVYYLVIVINRKN